MVDRKPLIAGNWKMNFDHLRAIAFVQKLGWTLKDANFDYRSVEIAVFPPFTDIRSVQTLIESDRLDIAFGAQDLSQHDSGAHTGDVSGEFLGKLGCRFVIVGHSERRSDHHEDDQLIREKAITATKHGLIPIICVGETSEDLEKFGASAVPVKQLSEILNDFPSNKEFVVAYEPVWAIGSGVSATPADAQKVCSALRKVVVETIGEAAGESTRILYGGSVKANNIAALLRENDIDGALVGGASLDAEEFAKIVQFQRHVIA